MKILNLYAGIGGNRKLWGDEHEITAIEINPKIATIYQELFPNDKVIVDDAHVYLLAHYEEFDFIWSSPPCPTHSRMRLLCDVQEGKPKKYPDMMLYEEIVFLKQFFKGVFVIENVISYYEPLIKPFIIGNHYYWSNKVLPGKREEKRMILRMTEKEIIKDKEKRFGYNLSKFDVSQGLKTKMLNNAVEPLTGKYIFDNIFKTKQEGLDKYKEE